MSNQKLNDKRKAFSEEWVRKDQELEVSFLPLRGQQPNIRRMLPKKKSLEEYKEKIREATDKHSQRVLL